MITLLAASHCHAWGGQVFGISYPLIYIQEEIPVIYIPSLASLASSEASEPIAPSVPILLSTPKPRPGREPLRHILLGSREGVDEAVRQLHILKYAEQFEWSRAIAVPENGILITPNQGEVLRYLIRWRVSHSPSTLGLIL